MVHTETASNNNSSSPSRHNYDGIDLGEGRLELPKRVTANPSGDGRAWFARGWLQTLNYNHEEAMACFNRCIEEDKTCMMGLWGIGERTRQGSTASSRLQ